MCFRRTEGSLFGAEGTDQELPVEGQVTLRCPIPDLPDRTITWHSASGVELFSGREFNVTQAGLYFCVSSDIRGRFVSNYIHVHNPGGAAANGEWSFLENGLGLLGTHSEKSFLSYDVVSCTEVKWLPIANGNNTLVP